MHGEAQLILIDTPGIFTPKRRLDRAMVKAAWSGVRDADAALLVLDAAARLSPEAELSLKGLAETGKPLYLALNKIDAVARPSLLALAEELNARADFAATFMISALKGDGLEDLKAALCAALPESPFLYPADQAADVPAAMLAAEITREKLFERLHEELPYALTVEPESWERRKDGSIRISQVIYVRRAGQKAIVLGAGGRNMKAVGAAARRTLEEMLDCRVHLFVFVKQRADWPDDPARYRAMGLDYGA